MRSTYLSLFDVLDELFSFSNSRKHFYCKHTNVTATLNHVKGHFQINTNLPACVWNQYIRCLSELVSETDDRINDSSSSVLLFLLLLL